MGINKGKRPDHGLLIRALIAKEVVRKLLLTVLIFWGDLIRSLCFFQFSLSRWNVCCSIIIVARENGNLWPSLSGLSRRGSCENVGTGSGRICINSRFWQNNHLKYQLWGDFYCNSIVCPLWRIHCSGLSSSAKDPSNLWSYTKKKYWVLHEVNLSWLWS